MNPETLQAIINALQMNGNMSKYFEWKDKENALLERIDASLASIIDRQEKQAQIFLEYIGKRGKEL